MVTRWYTTMWCLLLFHNSDASSQHSANSPGNLERGTGNSKLTPSSHKSSHSLHSKGGSSTTPGGAGTNASANAGKVPDECPLCYDVLPSSDEYYALLNCKHYACRACLENYLMIQISESRTDISCPQCSDSMHPTDIQTLLKAFPTAITKYEDFMVRRVLLSDPDSRWCPGPDCTYAVIATGCASCPRICCQRPGCDVQFCYHCKAEWHPDQTCDAARASRQSPTRALSGSIRKNSQHSKISQLGFSAVFLRLIYCLVVCSSICSFFVSFLCFFSSNLFCFVNANS
uniref:RBR-type E3 ubiquitin transferase n=1 Tax=Anopheles melas TaxID=34690 RepID=A0A182TTC5_9DIPT